MSSAKPRTAFVNPWEMGRLCEDEYARLVREYGLEPFVFTLKDEPFFTRRPLILGHDRFDLWFGAVQSGQRAALVSGFMASGFVHLGTLTVLRQMAYYQRVYGAKLFIPIADVEAAVVRKVPKAMIRAITEDLVLHVAAAGIDLSSAELYLQSRHSRLLREVSLLTGQIDIPELETIYDRRLTLGEAVASLTMSADILLPQVLGFQNTLVTLGIDEISHFILTKALVAGFDGFTSPSITYHRMIPGLQGPKMGKSRPDDSVQLANVPGEGEQKILSLTGDPDAGLPVARSILAWFGEDGNDAARVEDPASVIRSAAETVRTVLEQHHARMSSVERDAKQRVDELFRE